MISALRAEFRKLLSIRSTYGILAFVLLFEVLLAGFAKGYKLSGAELLNPHALQDALTVGVTATAAIGSLVSVILVTQEYRYSTILYALTNNRSRAAVIFAKLVTASFYAVVVTSLVAALAPLLAWGGVHVAGHSLPAQSIAYHDLIWRVLFYGWGYNMAALLIGALLRNQIAAIVTLFVVPATVEGLLGILVLKDNVTYLPFSALGAVMQAATGFSYHKAALIFLAYIVGGWVIGWMLFLRRDAN